jgi:FMN-dependent NADH-azoreductase
MRLLNIESSPRGSRSASIAVSSAFLEAYRQTCPGVTVDTLNDAKSDPRNESSRVKRGPQH